MEVVSILYIETIITKLVKTIFNSKQKVKVKWHNTLKKHYEELGYIFTKNGEEFEVFAEDLQPSSGTKVEVVCDYCGEKYYPTYHNFYSRKDKKHCCRKCSYLEAKDTCLIKYGVAHYSQTQECKEHKKQTMLDHYGVENPSQSEEIQQRKKETNLRKFGTEWYVESNDFKAQNIEIYGVENPMQSHEIREKAAKTISTNGSYRSSKEENKFVSILQNIFGVDKCLLGQNCRRYILDCLLIIDDIKIDVEYDGWYWHQLRQETDEIRDKYLLSQGYKVLRFVSKGTMPEKQIIIDCVKSLCETEQQFIQIQVDI